MSKTIIEKAISNLGYDEVESFIPNDILLGLRNYLKKESPSDLIDRKILEKIVLEEYKYKFMLEDSKLERVIRTLHKSDFGELTENIKTESLSEKHYDYLVSHFLDNKNNFAELVNEKELFYIASESKKNIKGIKNIEPNYGMYPYQKDIFNDALEIINNSSSSRAIIHMPTGAGKTRTAINIATQHLKEDNHNVVLWLANREELCKQAFDEFSVAWKSLGDRNLSQYGFYSDSEESMGGIDSGFIVGGLYKFINLEKKDDLLYKKLSEIVTLVIFDEAHMTIAEKFQSVVETFLNNSLKEPTLLGLTATPGRRLAIEKEDQENIRLKEFYQNNRIFMRTPGYISPIEYLIKNNYLANPTFKELSYEKSDSIGYDISLFASKQKEALESLSKDNYRNKALMDSVLKEIELGSQIIIFSTNMKHAKFFASLLLYKGIPAASVSTEDTVQARRIKIQKYKERKLRVLVNFNVLTAGFDAPCTNVVYIARPTESLVNYLQMAGRAMRGGAKGNKECRIYTVIDDIPEFKNIYKAFSHWDNLWSLENE